MIAVSHNQRSVRAQSARYILCFFSSPERRLDQPKAGGGLGEDCLSA